MDRNAIVLYLKEIRDLEFAQWKIVQSYNEGKNIFEKTRQDMIVPRVSDPGGEYVSSASVNWAYIIGGLILMPVPLLFVVGLYLWYKAAKMYSEEKKSDKEWAASTRAAMEAYKVDQARIESNREAYAAVEEQWNQKSKFWNDEYHTVKT